MITWVRYLPPRAAGYIPTPGFIEHKNCTVSIHTVGREDCFMLSCLVSWHNLQRGDTIDTKKDREGNDAPLKLNPLNRPREVEKFLKLTDLDLTGFEGVVDFDMLEGFEELNDLSVVVYGTAEDERSGESYIHPLRIPRERRGRQRLIPLLYLENDKGSHYVAIRKGPKTEFTGSFKDFSKLETFLKRPVAGQTDRNTATNTGYHSCPYCIRSFKGADLLDRHLAQDCTESLEAILTMPTPENGIPPACRHKSSTALTGDRSERSPFVI